MVYQTQDAIAIERKVECLMQANCMLFAKLPDAGIMILMQEPDAGEKDLH